MIRLPRVMMAATRQRRAVAQSPLSPRARILWTASNFCMLTGVVLLLYVGGIYANDEYGRYAARGDSDVPAPAAVANSDIAEPAPFVAPAEPAPFVAPALNTLPASQGTEAAPEHHSLVERVVIPSIALDSKVIEVGWEVQQQGDSQVAVWQVANYAVGQHRGSANPGEGNNIVLAGHVGGYGYVFRDLFYVHPGDEIKLYSAGQEYMYIVKERLVLDEEEAPPEQRAENAKLIGPTDSEVVTLVTCWPAAGPDKFSQRVVVRAVPFATTMVDTSQSSWTAR